MTRMDQEIRLRQYFHPRDLPPAYTDHPIPIRARELSPARYKAMPYWPRDEAMVLAYKARQTWVAEHRDAEIEFRLSPADVVVGPGEQSPGVGPLGSIYGVPLRLTGTVPPGTLRLVDLRALKMRRKFAHAWQQRPARGEGVVMVEWLPPASGSTASGEAG